MPIKKLIRTIPDFPKPGIMFRDVTTLFQDPEGFRTVIEILRERYADQEIDAVVGVESRGFIVGAPLALALGCAFIPMRKPGKLPAATHSETYELEYGTDELHIHVDAIKPGERVLIIDDLLATGGTARAAARLVKHCQGFIVEAAFIVDLPDLKGHEKLEDDGDPEFAICEFEGD
jgi:adenine phosphoribosyltransferase